MFLVSRVIRSSRPAFLRTAVSSVFTYESIVARVPCRGFFNFWKKKPAPKPVPEPLPIDLEECDKIDLSSIDNLPPEETKAIFNADNFNSFMDHKLQSKAYDHVADTFCLMLLKDIEPNIVSWALVVESFKLAGKLEEVEGFALQIAGIMSMSTEQKKQTLIKWASDPTEEELAQVRRDAAEDVQKLIDVLANPAYRRDTHGTPDAHGTPDTHIGEPPPPPRMQPH